MSAYEHCDGCQQATPATEDGLGGWLRVTPRWTLLFWPGPARSGDPPQPTVTFCSWRCLCEYATARVLITD